MKTAGIVLGEVALLYLDNSIAVIDAVDFERVAHLRWARMNHGYVGHSYKPKGSKAAKIMLLHRFILGAKSGQCVDHVNGVITDNRRANLRLSTRQENCINRRCWKRKTVQVKGVAWDDKSRKWKARITLDGKTQHLGRFSSLQDAAAAYDAAAKRLFGQFARPNLICS